MSPGVQKLGDAVENDADVSSYDGKMISSVFEMLDFCIGKGKSKWRSPLDSQNTVNKKLETEVEICFLSYCYCVTEIK